MLLTAALAEAPLCHPASCCLDPGLDQFTAGSVFLRQAHLGFFASEAEAARAYDLAALALGGPQQTAAAFTNFPARLYRCGLAGRRFGDELRVPGLFTKFSLFGHMRSCCHR